MDILEWKEIAGTQKAKRKRKGVVSKLEDAILLKEKQICQDFFTEVKELQNNEYFKKDFFIFHVANEVPQTKFTRQLIALFRMSQKKMGVVGGVSDYIVLYENGWLAIEFKRSPTEKLTDKQKEFAEICDNLNQPFYVAYTVDMGIKILEKHFN